MGDGPYDLQSLTRALLLGTSLISLSALSACIASGRDPISAVELQSFNEAVRAGQSRNVLAFMQTFPNSSLIPALLEVQTPTTLKQIPQTAVLNLPASTVSALSPRVRSQLALPEPQTPTGRAARTILSEGAGRY